MHHYLHVPLRHHSVYPPGMFCVVMLEIATIYVACIDADIEIRFGCIAFFTAVKWTMLICTIDMDRCGLYCEEGKWYYKRILCRRKKMDVSNVQAIKITYAHCREVNLNYFAKYPYKNKDGEVCRTMFLLKNVINDPGQDSMDELFAMEYRKSIICRCVYDEQIIKKLQEINNDICVINIACE